MGAKITLILRQSLVKTTGLNSTLNYDFLRSEKLLNGVYAMNFNKPSKIQETALPMLLADP